MRKIDIISHQYLFLLNTPQIVVIEALKFLGLAVPEDINLGKDNSLKAVWRTSNNERFLNYEAHFTILNTKSINRKWLEYLIKDEPLNNQYAPKSWIKYVENGLSEGIILGGALQLLALGWANIGAAVAPDAALASVASAIIFIKAGDFSDTGRQIAIATAVTLGTVGLVLLCLFVHYQLLSCTEQTTQLQMETSAE